MATLFVTAADIVYASDCLQVDQSSPECVTVDRKSDAYCQTEDQIDIAGVHANAKGESPWPTAQGKDVGLSPESVAGQGGGTCKQRVKYAGATLSIVGGGNGSYNVTVSNTALDVLTNAPMTAVTDPAGNDLWLTDATSSTVPDPDPDRRHHYIFFRNRPKAGGALLPKYLIIEAFDKDCRSHEPVLDQNVTKGICQRSPNKSGKRGLDETGVGGGGEQK